jgi:hypothetical protein
MSHIYFRAARAVLIFSVLAVLSSSSSAYEAFSAGGATGAADSVVIASAIQFADSADGTRAVRPSIRAHRLNGDEIRVDGRLDDSGWTKGEAGRGFRMWDPDRGAAASEQTIFKIAYDEGSIYVGVACLERDPSKITAKLSRRDRFSNSDLVSVYLDPYLDRTTGYNFRVNPLGVQEDAYIYNNDVRDPDWDAVWEAKTSRDDKGWYAEMRIPFSAIRYRAAASMVWGLQVYRYMHGRGEDTAWAMWSRETSGLVSNFGTVTGIDGIHSPRQLEIMPYVVQSSTDYSTTASPDEVQGFQNLGADLKYGVTADLTLNATVQPDFGQVEADPAVLNLSPFETFYDEKRPFFIEGSRFFEHPYFNLFYSRRIGTGAENARIRYAAKLTGKAPGGVSVAALAASTDFTDEGQAHNLFKNGTQVSRYFVGRFGKEFAQGRHHFNVMQTARLNTADRATYGNSASREAYTTGLDFEMSSPKRTNRVSGSFVGSVIDPEPIPSDPTLSDKPGYGTGGTFRVQRTGGRWRGSLDGRWESNRLALNDLGFLEAPDEIASSIWIQRQFNPEGKSKVLNRANLNLNGWRSWIYAGRTGYDAVSSAEVWSYGKGHPQYSGGNVNGWMQLRSYWEIWGGSSLNGTGTHRFETRGGPLMREPFTYGGWWGFKTDTRKTLVFTHEGSWFKDTALNVSLDLMAGVTWNQSSAVSHEITLEYDIRNDDTQYIETVDLASRPGGAGIGGLSYVYGDLAQKTVDLTVRSNILFSRTHSLEVYAQPFVSVGEYARMRELAAPDTYELIAYNEPGYNNGAGYNASDFDFTVASVNFNVVYRWEYRPGSTFFLVWKQSRYEEDYRSQFAGNPSEFHNDLGSGLLFGNEPENTVLAKISYWFAI